MIDVYGHHRIISVHAAGEVLRVLAQNLKTGKREYLAVPLTWKV